MSNPTDPEGPSDPGGPGGAGAPVPRRGDIVDTDAGVHVLVVSSTVYNEIRSEPTVVIVPVFATEPDAGFGVDLGDSWAAPGLISSLRKTRLRDHVRHVRPSPR